jgi:hypothetical protein
MLFSTEKERSIVHTTGMELMIKLYWAKEAEANEYILYGFHVY